MHTKYNCSVLDIVKDNTNMFSGLFFQDNGLVRMYQHYPDIVFIDGTYKLHSNNASTYIFIGVDGEGNDF